MRPYASNKPSYIKIILFFGALSTKKVKKNYNVTTSNVFLTKKGLKRPKPDFSQNFHFFSKVNPKWRLNMQNLEDPMNGFRKISRFVDFWPKIAILTKNGQNDQNVTSGAFLKIRTTLWTDFWISTGRTHRRTNVT